MRERGGEAGICHMEHHPNVQFVYDLSPVMLCCYCHHSLHLPFSLSSVYLHFLHFEYSIFGVVTYPQKNVCATDVYFVYACAFESQCDSHHHHFRDVALSTTKARENSEILA